MGLDTLIRAIKNSPVSIGFLKDRVPDRVDVISYEMLKGKHRSKIFRGKRAVIVLIPKKGSKMGHFIVLIPRKNHIEYFSSLGNSWEKELEMLHEPTDIFQKLLGKQFIYNRVKLQKNTYTINDCAAWVLVRVYLSKLKLREFTNLFSRRVTLSNSDDIMAMLAILLFVDKSQ